MLRGARELSLRANGPFCAVLGDRTDDERRLQDQCLAGSGRVPPDHLADLLEAVSHGVGVHEELACGGFEGATIVEIAPQGLEEFA